MSSEAEQWAARNARIQNAIEQVRGLAETSGGAVTVETDSTGTITDLRISQAAMSVEPARLAKAIAQCHQTARERAHAEATRLYTELMDAPEISPQASARGPQAVSEEWEEITPLPITHSF